MDNSTDTPAAIHGPRPVRAALNICLVFVLLMLLVLRWQQGHDYHPFALQPGVASGLWGVLFAPLLHGSFEHFFSNAFSILVLGTLGGALYPKALIRALPFIWLLSGLGTWWIALRGYHIGASGITHGLMFFLLMMAALRRDKSSIAAAFIAITLFGGMFLGVLPQKEGISWEYHLSGAVAGLLTAALWHKRDPKPQRAPYSWEIDNEVVGQDDLEREGLEPPRPSDVPVLWHRPEPSEPERGVVLAFKKRDE